MSTSNPSSVPPDYPDYPSFKTKPVRPAAQIKKGVDMRAVYEAMAAPSPRPVAPPPWYTNPVPEPVISPWIAASAAQVASPAAQAPVAPLPIVKKLPSLKAFVASDQEIEGSIWTNDLIAECLAAELWRTRDVDEVIREGDLMVTDDAGTLRYDRIMGWKDAPLTQEMIDLHACTIFTLEGAGKPRKSIVIRSTTEFKDLMSVPKGTQMRLPTDENEAKRFFGCDVIITELIEKGKPVKCFYPVPQRMADRVFRCAFSRVFPDFAKKHFREYIKGLIIGRGEGLRLPRNHKDRKDPMSPRHIIDLIEGNVPGTKKKTKPLTVEEVSMKVNLPVDIINQCLARRDYQRLDRPVMPFLERMDARQLTPAEFKYDKALGIEIETVTPLSHDAAQKRVPRYVRCATDGSIRDHAGNKPNQTSAWGIEYRILIKRSELETRVLKAVEAISNMGASVNKSCGLHVHFDMRDKNQTDAKVIHDRMAKWVAVLKELVPPSRRDNTYCRFEGADNDHHAAVSFGSYSKHKTIEVRVHSATLNNIKIIQWVRLIEAIIETKFLPMAKTSTLDGLKMLNLTEADRTYWLKRHQQLNPDLYKGGKLTDLSFLGAKADEIE